MKRFPPGQWAKRAACRGHDPNLFFPSKGEVLKHIRAKTICTGCEVSVECFAHALRNREEQGIWGGVTFRNGRPFKRRTKQEEGAA